MKEERTEKFGNPWTLLFPQTARNALFSTGAGSWLVAAIAYVQKEGSGG